MKSKDISEELDFLLAVMIHFNTIPKATHLYPPITQNSDGTKFEENIGIQEYGITLKIADVSIDEKYNETLKKIKSVYELLENTKSEIEKGVKNENWYKERTKKIRGLVGDVLRELSIRVIDYNTEKKTYGLDDLEKIFIEMKDSATKLIRYFEELSANKNLDGELVLDAIHINIIRLGESIHKAEKIQDGFWESFGDISILSMKKRRNKMAHGIIFGEKHLREMKTEVHRIKQAVCNVIFGEKNSKNKGEHTVTAAINVGKYRSLPVTGKGERAEVDKTGVIVYIDPHGVIRFIRIGKGKENILITGLSSFSKNK